MPTPTAGAPLDEQEDRNLQPGGGDNSTSQTARRKRKRKRDAHEELEEDSDSEAMSPEEEASVSPPAAVIAGRDDEERRMLSPQSGSQFLHDDTVQPPMSRLQEDEDDEASSEDERKSAGKKCKTKGDGVGTTTGPPLNSASFIPDAGDDSCGTSDVEKFDGKIVYNPDGSAYIIEDSELSEEDATSLADLPQIIGDGCIVDGRGVSLSQSFVFPQIANAFYVSRNPSFYNALYGGAAASYAANNVLQDKKIVPEVPIMHSYRVFTVRDNKSGDSDDGKAERSGSGNNEGKKSADKTKTKQLLLQKKNEKYSGKDCSSVPVKPILMCFICKLSFGYAKSFVAHAMGDHNVALLEDEKDILGHKNASAIIQCVGKDKEPLVSFLEPLSPVSVGLDKPAQRDPAFSATEVKNEKVDAHRTSPPSDGGRGESKNKGSDCGGSAGHFEAESLVMHRRQSQDNSTTSASGLSNVQNQHVPETSVSLPQNGSSSSNNNNNNNNNNRMIGVGINSVMDLTRKSPISASAASSGNNGRSSVSPGASPSPGSTLGPLLSAAVAAAAAGNAPALSFPQPPPNFLTGTTIGVCPDHMGGRPSGVECAKCELILSSSRLGGVGGPLAGMHSRNSCKTLKCPKCNWHYKYQETLEIHMKEKHPETETSCIYCIAGQPHPRLARGETYTCGYKPYRCEVCNYSTTTKGNLSIHMQSDKHLNNMQELQNGGVSSGESTITGPGLHSQASQSSKGGLVSPGSGSSGGAVTGSGHHHHQHHPHTPLSSGTGSAQNQKQKPTFRCDVCNYETNVARNLRIHMTSEKHTHNMMVLQQNVKHMHTLSALHQQQHPPQQQQLSFESLLHFHPGLTLPGDKPPPHTEAALADMAYNQALLIQMMTGGQLPPHIPPELAPHMDMGLNPDTMEPPPEPADPNPSHMFHCCVCNVFSTDSLEALSHHLSADRTKIREQEILAVVAGHYVCKLCTYKTNLKANFQLHCKTDKHLQRLQHVNHVKEGGPRNEWKLKYVSSPGGIQVRCHACDYYTNSAHKLQLHAAGQRHEASCLLFMHLRETEALCEAPRIYHCALCGFSSRAKLQLLQHVRSMKHLQMEQIHQLQRRSEGKDLQTDIGEVFQVVSQLDPPGYGDSELDRNEVQHHQHHQQNREQRESCKSEQNKEIMMKFPMDQHAQESDDLEQHQHKAAQQHMCPYCNYTSSSEMRIQAHVLAQHSQSEPSPPSSSPARDFLCPLCQDGFRDRSQLERHVMQIHSVNSEGLQRLLLLVDQSHWLNAVSRSAPSTPHTQQQTPPNQNSHHSQMISPSSATSSAGSSSGGKDLDLSGKQNHSDVNSNDDRDETLQPDLLSPSPDDQMDMDEFRCQTCFRSCRNIDELCMHQNETGHLEIKQTPNGPGYLCWKKGCNQYFPTAHSLQMHFREIHTRGGVPGTPGHQQTIAVSEKHVYKYRCNQCSLAFKTMEKLQLHSQYHLIRDATKCVLCGRSFRSVLALHKHVETSHSELSEDELAAYKQSLMSNPLLLAGLSGQVLDPSTNDLLKKESLKMESDEIMDVDESPSKDQSHGQEDGIGNSVGDGENSDDSVVYKEQQFLEDYLNSQAIAEDSYNDPNRKYKCHRCKVAFTRQSYLTSHNKTLLHRKGEKLSYPMEKYLDPNRPYKCDVCKESFTQKNILLVHYNSVSHLHKLKRAMQEQQQQQNNNNNNNNGVSAVSPHAVATAAAALAASLGVTPPPTPKSTPICDDDDKKPYKCNICKVAYSQGSTLDIHMRSVLHQTRASKLQDLAITGQIDLSKPLIEQPEPQKAQDQHKKMLQDFLGASPKQQSVSSSSLTSPSSGGSSSISSSGVSSQVPSLAPGSSPVTGSNIVPQSTAAAATASASTSTNPIMSSVPNSLSNNATNTSTSNSMSNHNHHHTQAPPSPQQQHGMVSCQRCSALFVSQEQLNTHQQLYCLFGSPMTLFPPLPAPSQNSVSVSSQASHSSPQPNAKTPPPLSTTPHQEEPFMRLSVPGKKSSQVYKHLLESFGFDLVMQFNENHQRRQRKEREDEETMLPAASTQTPLLEEQEQLQNQTVMIKLEDEPLVTVEQDLPEVAKSVCQHCRKEFSSVWVLKAHCEEVHRDLVPPEFLEKYAQQFKSEYEKKTVVVTAATSTTPTGTTVLAASAGQHSVATSTSNSSNNIPSNIDLIPEKDVEDSKEAVQVKIAQQQQHQQQQQQQSMQGTPPERPTTAPSTPTASSTPASSTDSIPATLSTSMAATGSMGGAGASSSANSSLSMSLAQQMSEMQAALNVMAASQLQQQLQQFSTPMMMGMAGLGMGLPLGLNMNALAAMNLQPPLVPMMMPPPPFDPLSLAQAQNSMFSPQAAAAGMDPGSILAKQQQHLLQQQQQAVTAAQQKRARTRITDDQLKILRAHFDINNSPSEDQIHEMASQSGLPPKVIKHWFRNTLFKERQRNKDSPYNFNNPPSTTLNLEEYEKTGEAKVMPLNSSGSGNEDQTPIKEAAPARPSSVSTGSSSNKRKQSQPQPFPPPQAFPQPAEMIKTEPREMSSHHHDNQDHKFNNFFMESEHGSSNRKEGGGERILDLADEKPPHSLYPPPSPVNMMASNTSNSNNNNNDNSSSVPPSSIVRSSSPSSLTLTSIIASQLGSDSITTTHPTMNATNMTVTSSHSSHSNTSNMLPPKLTPPNFPPPSQVPTSPGILPPLGSSASAVSRSVSPGRSYSNNSSDGFSHASLTPGGCGSGGGNSNGSNSSGGSSGKRANRTRFTDYQIKVLQEFFENNAYPKDDDLEYLSKLLSLSPRVIVVWFQNARQKARKVYENQPPVEAPPGVEEGGANRFQRTPGLNYQCKKCLLVFQRYYELIRHQKTHCFKEEDAKRSAQAQAAAAQIAAVLSSEDSNSSTIAEPSQQQPQQPPQPQPQQQQQQQSSASSNPATPSAAVTPTPPSSLFPPSPISGTPGNTENTVKEGTFQCDKCNLVFPRFDLWREHQLVHIMNPNLFPTYPPDSPFGILQQHAQIQQQQQQQQQQQMAAMGVSDLSINSTSTAQHSHPLASVLSNRRKFEEFDDTLDRDCDQPKDKRLRTTILPEQLDYLYQKYQLESNPSRKMLENIAREVGLKKRVVQVWFQNTRARERKGQFRAHAQVINKRCPFCPALFKVKSALESHLVTKHADQCTRGEINIDNLPDEELSMESAPSSHMGDSGKVSTNFGSTTPTPNMMPPLFPPFHTDMENSLKKYYEESMKRYISELQAHHAAHNGGIGKEGLQIPTDLSMKIKQEPSTPGSEGGGSSGGTGGGGDGPLDLSKPVDLSRPVKVSLDHDSRSIMAEPGPLTDLSERSMCYEDDSMSETTENMDGDESNPTSPASSTQSSHQRPTPSGGGKRFRTQMSSLQVKAMKSLFNDYKTPTMAECEMLGREIGLPKRVVQVWFQNARAKEKKNKIALQKVLGGPETSPSVVTSSESSRPPEECKLCQFKYSHKYSIQDHIFTKKHIDNVKAHIESGKSDTSGNTSDGGGSGSGAGEFTVPPVPGSSGGTGGADSSVNTTVPSQPSPQFINNSIAAAAAQQQQLAQLQMLQMAAASGLALPNSLSAQAQAMAAAAAAAAANSTKDQQGSGGSKSPAPGPEDMALLHQLYGLGLAGFPGAMQAGNLFLHPAMFSAAAAAGGGGSGGGLFEPSSGHCGGGGGGSGGTPIAVLQLPATTLQAVGEASASCEPGVSTVRIPAPADADTSPLMPSQAAYCREVESEVGFVCKKCRLAFPGETALLGHQRVACYPGISTDLRGAVRLVQLHYECKLCSSSAERERMSSLHDFKRHCETDAHISRFGASSQPPCTPPTTTAPLPAKHPTPSPRLPPSQHQQPPAASLSPSAGLSHEMEDVVNQITLLAARAAAESTAPIQGPGGAPTDSNANIAGSKDTSDFCHPAEPKRNKLLQLHAGDGPQSVAVPSTGQ